MRQIDVSKIFSVCLGKNAFSCRYPEYRGQFTTGIVGCFV